MEQQHAADLREQRDLNNKKNRDTKMSCTEREMHAWVTEGTIVNPAKYLGTRRKDGHHYMEVRRYNSFQVRIYVNPRYVVWKGEPPEFKWGDKMKDFI
jgi:hypothetical protein